MVAADVLLTNSKGSNCFEIFERDSRTHCSNGWEESRKFSLDDISDRTTVLYDQSDCFSCPIFVEICIQSKTAHNRASEYRTRLRDGEQLSYHSHSQLALHFPFLFRLGSHFCIRFICRRRLVPPWIPSQHHFHQESIHEVPTTSVVWCFIVWLYATTRNWRVSWPRKSDSLVIGIPIWALAITRIPY